MEEIKEKLHPMTIWCMYSKYFSKNFAEHSTKFAEVSSIVNRKMANNLLEDEDIIKYARAANKYLNFDKPFDNYLDCPQEGYVEAKKINKIKKRSKEKNEETVESAIIKSHKDYPRIETLLKEAEDLRKRGLYYHYNTNIKLVKELKRSILLESEE